MDQTLMLTEEDAAVSKITAIIDAFIEEAEATLLQIDVKSKGFERSGKFLKDNKMLKSNALYVNNIFPSNRKQRSKMHKKMVKAVEPLPSPSLSKTLISSSSSVKSPSESTFSSPSAAANAITKKALLLYGNKNRPSSSSCSSSRTSRTITTTTNATTNATTNSATSSGPSLESCQSEAESRLSLNFTAVVKDPKTGKSHSLNVAAKCLDGVPSRVYINGKAFGPCQDQ